MKPGAGLATSRTWNSGALYKELSILYINYDKGRKAYIGTSACSKSEEVVPRWRKCDVLDSSLLIIN